MTVLMVRGTSRRTLPGIRTAIYPFEADIRDYWHFRVEEDGTDEEEPAYVRNRLLSTIRRREPQIT